MKPNTDVTLNSQENPQAVYLKYRILKGNGNTMTIQEQLWYLIVGLLDESYDIKTFCREFTRIYNLETDYTQLTQLENREFSDLCDMAGRFTADREELSIPNLYYSKEEIFDRARRVRENLSPRETGVQTNR